MTMEAKKAVGGVEGMEKRTFQVQDLRIEKRADGKGRQVRGYAAVFNSWSQDLGGFKERILPGCFARAIREKQDVRALIDHDSGKVLGRSISGTLRMTEDDKGLAVEIDMPETSYANDLSVCMERGDITQMSFGFRTVRDDWGKKDNSRARDLLDVDLFDVSVVTYPAYTDTSVAIRSMKTWEAIEADEDVGIIDLTTGSVLLARAAREDQVRQWVTINGAHIDIGEDGNVAAGPSHLIGAKGTGGTLKTSDMAAGDKVHLDRWNGGPQGGTIQKIGTKNVVVSGTAPDGTPHDFKVPKEWVSHVVKDGTLHPVDHKEHLAASLEKLKNSGAEKNSHPLEDPAVAKMVSEMGR